jgi:hypothetical protein
VSLEELKSDRELCACQRTHVFGCLATANHGCIRLERFVEAPLNVEPLGSQAIGHGSVVADAASRVSSPFGPVLLLAKASAAVHKLRRGQIERHIFAFQRPKVDRLPKLYRYETTHH